MTDEARRAKRSGVGRWGFAALPVGAFLGVVLGTLVGGVLGNMAMGAAIGAGLGLGLGLVLFAAAVVSVASRGV